MQKTITAYHGTIFPFDAERVLPMTHFSSPGIAARAATTERFDVPDIPNRPAHYFEAEITIGRVFSIDDPATSLPTEITSQLLRRKMISYETHRHFLTAMHQATRPFFFELRHPLADLLQEIDIDTLAYVDRGANAGEYSFIITRSAQLRNPRWLTVAELFGSDRRHTF